MYPVDQSTIHLPDLAFVRFCEQHYHINRGVYNVIEEWFYQKGLTEIVHRRRTILQFLEQRKVTLDTEEKREKFGPGGVSSQLSHFWQAQACKKTG